MEGMRGNAMKSPDASDGTVKGGRGRVGMGLSGFGGVHYSQGRDVEY